MPPTFGERGVHPTLRDAVRQVEATASAHAAAEELVEDHVGIFVIPLVVYESMTRSGTELSCRKLLYPSETSKS